jgi:3-oxosteroid 1-dehydrogenase
MYARHATTPAIPAWAVFDARARKRYMFGGRFPGAMPREWVEQGCIKQHATIAGLAQQCGIDPKGLEETVARFNRFAEDGVDEDYHRGDSAYNRYMSDPTNKPNPCLGALSEPPFWAAPLYPGDVGTCGGAWVNERSQVMRGDGSVIDGLFAAGNCAASLCGPYYVGAGQSVGAFGFIAATQAAR